jgi:hypothetical protein
MLGATVRLEGGGGLRRVHTDGSYLAVQDPRLLFAPDTAGPSTALVTWPDGSRERFAGLEAGRYHRLVMGQGQAGP